MEKFDSSGFPEDRDVSKTSKEEFSSDLAMLMLEMVI